MKKDTCVSVETLSEEKRYLCRRRDTFWREKDTCVRVETILVEKNTCVGIETVWRNRDTCVGVETFFWKERDTFGGKDTPV